MSKSDKTYRLIISGGGTGGHIYPAIAIANRFKEEFPKGEICFVGAEGRMEMEKVPKAGYDIIGLPVAGIQRRITWKNLLFPFKLINSILQARRIIKDFKPDVVVGVGGYASAPIARAAVSLKIPVVLQEQNSYAGLVNKWIGKRASKICVAYTGMEKYFPKNKIVLTGNPVRQDIIDTVNKNEALSFFGLDDQRPVILVLGGSLGARTINESMLKGIDKINALGIQVLWQTGKSYYEELSKQINSVQYPNIHLHEFIYEMDKAYATADVVISRAGALSISELCLVGKPVVLVPSPNVAEDHQTSNAMALVNKQAALIVKDNVANQSLVSETLKLIKDKTLCQQLSSNIKALALPDAAGEIVSEIKKILVK